MKDGRDKKKMDILLNISFSIGISLLHMEIKEMED